MANETSNTSDDNEKRTVVREDLINTAVKFLHNPNVQKSTLVYRQSFLKKKGLTHVEIHIACQRAGAYTQLTNHEELQTKLQRSPQAALQPQTYIPLPVSPWTRLRYFAETTAIIGGVAYGLYMLYKKYIEPLLFGIEKEQKSIQDSIAELSDSLNKIHADLDQVKQQQQQLKCLPEFAYFTSRQLRELKFEITIIKGILLSKQHFATYTSHKTTPSIPVWQMTSAAEQQEAQQNEAEEAEKEANVEEDTEGSTSWSGYSENEVVILTGSDSSLEMIRE